MIDRVISYKDKIKIEMADSNIIKARIKEIYDVLNDHDSKVTMFEKVDIPMPKEIKPTPI